MNTGTSYSALTIPTDTDPGTSSSRSASPSSSQPDEPDANGSSRGHRETRTTAPTFADLVAVHPLILAHLKLVAPLTILRVSRDLYFELVPKVYADITLDERRARGLFVGFLPLSSEHRHHHQHEPIIGSVSGSRESLKRPYGRYLELPEVLPGRRARSSPPAVTSTSNSTGVGASTSTSSRTIVSRGIGAEQSRSQQGLLEHLDVDARSDSAQAEYSPNSRSGSDPDLGSSHKFYQNPLGVHRDPQRENQHYQGRYNRKSRALSYTTKLSLQDAESLSIICAAHIEVLSYSPILSTRNHRKNHGRTAPSHGTRGSSHSGAGSGYDSGSSYGHGLGHDHGNTEEQKWPLRNVRTLTLGWPLIEYLAESHSPDSNLRQQGGRRKALPICCIPIEATTLVVNLEYEAKLELASYSEEPGRGEEGERGGGAVEGGRVGEGYSYVRRTIVELASEFHLDVLEVRLKLGLHGGSDVDGAHNSSGSPTRNDWSDTTQVPTTKENTYSIPISLSELTPALTPIIRLKIETEEKSGLHKDETTEIILRWLEETADDLAETMILTSPANTTAAVNAGRGSAGSGGGGGGGFIIRLPKIEVLVRNAKTVERRLYSSIGADKQGAEASVGAETEFKDVVARKVLNACRFFELAT
ncbi:hypothetical protein IAU59_005472 [Kwoniella sp. CBS 9459]